MKRAKGFVTVLVTAPDMRTARTLVRAALKAKLIACANILPGIESHYWWQEKIEGAKEVLLLLKTTTKRIDALEKVIVSNHPYDTPEFVVLKIDSGNHRYLTWLNQSLQDSTTH